MMTVGYGPPARNQVGTVKFMFEGFQEELLTKEPTEWLSLLQMVKFRRVCSFATSVIILPVVILPIFL